MNGSMLLQFSYFVTVGIVDAVAAAAALFSPTHPFIANSLTFFSLLQKSLYLSPFHLSPMNKLNG